MTRLTFSLLVILVLSGGINRLHSQVGFTDSEREGLFIKVPGSAVQEIYSNPDERILKAKVSPRQDWLAAIVYNRVVRDAEGWANRDILVFHNRKIVGRIKGKIKKFDWSPEGGQLVYIEGRYDIDMFDMLLGRSLYLYDVSTRKTKKLTESVNDEIFWDVTWAEFDGNIYLWTQLVGEGWKVYRVDQEAGERELTDYKAVNFSPDGKFYFEESGEGGSPAMLFKRATNEQIYKSPTDEGRAFLGWGVSSEGERLLYLRDGHLNVSIVNCDQGGLETMVERSDYSVPIFDGKDIHWTYRDPDGRLQLLKP